MPFKGNIVDFYKVPPMMRGFYLIYGISLLAATFPAALIFFYIRDYLGAQADPWIYLGLYFGSGLLTLPLWLYAAKKFGQSNVWFAAMLLSVIAFCGAIFLGQGDLWGFGIICVASGLSFGVEFALPPLILKRLIDISKDMHPAKRFALMAFLGKAALALVGVMVFPALNFFGFKPEQENAPETLAILSFCYAAVPCIIKSFALYTSWQWIKTYGGNFEKTTAPITSGDSHAA